MIHERLSNGNANKIDNIGYHSIIIDIVQKLPDNYHSALKILIGNLSGIIKDNINRTEAKEAEERWEREHGRQRKCTV